MTAYVLYDNILNQDGVTLDYTHEVDESGRHAHDWLLWNRWVPGTTATYAWIDIDLENAYEVDAVSIFGHNLGTEGCSIYLERSSNNFATAGQTVVYHTPTDDSPIFLKFTAVNYQYYRLVIHNPTNNTQIYNAQICKSLQLKPLAVGFRPPMYETFTATNNVNRHGVLLGRSISKSTRKLTISQNAITPSEMESSFLPWLEHATKYPFVFCWDYENRPQDTVFCWFAKDAPDPVYSNLCYLSLQMKVEAMLWKEAPAL